MKEIKNISQSEISQVHSINDPLVKRLISETPEGKHPYYHAIGILGGNSVKDKYKNMK